MIDIKKTTARKIKVKLLKTKDEENPLKHPKENDTLNKGQ